MLYIWCSDCTLLQPFHSHTYPTKFLQVFVVVAVVVVVNYSCSTKFFQVFVVVAVVVVVAAYMVQLLYEISLYIYCTIYDCIYVIVRSFIVYMWQSLYVISAIPFAHAHFYCTCFFHFSFFIFLYVIAVLSFALARYYCTCCSHRKRPSIETKEA